MRMGAVPTQIVHPHYCYILALEGDDRVTYIGYTINIHRRLRQHNGELVGGARFTTRHGPAKGKRWRVVALVTAPDLDHHRGLSLEWHIKHPDGHRRRPPQSRCAAERVKGMVRAMVHGKFSDDHFTAWVLHEFKAVLLQAMVDAGHMQRCDVLTWPPSDDPVLGFDGCGCDGDADIGIGMDCDQSAVNSDNAMDV